MGQLLAPRLVIIVFLVQDAQFWGILILGDNVKIGANAIVTKGIPDNCTVVTKGTSIVKMNGKKVNIIL